ncbi:MAG TPA: protein kinase [Polyangiales bacterium]|nr:protein kinase [Polyangiales bacterium]
MKEAREDSIVLRLVQPDRPAPRRVGRYDICFELAAGGMATIYLARVDGPGGFRKLVALKCIHPHLVRQAGFVEMFLDEARLASRISHPNVCSVFDFGFADSTYYIAMEMLVGEMAGRVCRVVEQHPTLSPLPAHAGYCGRIIADAAEGLHAAHELRGDDGQPLQVVHRDVSPQNLIVTYDGAVKVMDFGIARALDQLHLTRTGTVRGKFPYMAPEQLEQGVVDRRADVWSLGVVLWELLTGKQLFHREREVDTMRAVLSAPIPAPSSIRPGIPRAFDEIALRALARNPSRRFATARELVLALERPALHLPSQGALGEWLQQLFPDLHARRLELLDQARQMAETSVPRVSRALSEITVDTHRHTEPRAALDAAVGRPARNRRMLLLAASAASVLLLAGALWARLAQPSDPAEDTPASTTASRAPTAVPAASKPVAQRAPLDPVATGMPVTGTPVLPAGSPAAEAVRAEHAGETRAPAARRALGQGLVNVATPGGWADVIVAGRHHGRTPLQLELPEGRRTLILKPFGKGSVRRPVLVRRNRPTRVVVPVHGLK